MEEEGEKEKEEDKEGEEEERGGRRYCKEAFPK